MAELEYVTIDVTKKMVDFEHVTHNDNGKDYARIIAPNGGCFFYPVSSLKESATDPNRVYFMRPVGTEITVHYSQRKEGVPDDAPNEEKYDHTTVNTKIEDLRQQYIDSRDQFKAQKQEEYSNQFMTMTVPESWGRHFESKQGESLVSISVAIKEDRVLYYNFVVSEDRFKTNGQGEASFSFPIKKKDDPSQDYMVKLRRDERQEDGSYVTVNREISTEDLAAAISANKKSADKIEIPISSKLIRHFESKDGKDMVSVAVPVLASYSPDKAVFYYQIVVPAYRIKEQDNGYGTMKTFLTLPDSDTFMLQAERSYKAGVDPNGVDVYEKDVMTLSARDVQDCFERSNKRYEESKNAEQTIPDDFSPDESQQETQQNQVQHHRGR